MNFFNFGDSPDRSADTSFAFSFSGNGDVGQGGNKDDNKGSSKAMFGSDWTAVDSKTFSKPDANAPVLKKTKVEKPSPMKRSPEKVPEQIYHREDQHQTGAVHTPKAKDDILEDVTNEDIQQKVDMTETMKDCMDDIRREFSTFLPQLQAHKVMFFLANQPKTQSISLIYTFNLFSGERCKYS